MHEMQTIATDDPVAWSVCQSICLSVTRLRHAKTAKLIEVLFGFLVSVLGVQRTLY